MNSGNTNSNSNNEEWSPDNPWMDAMKKAHAFASVTIEIYQEHDRLPALRNFVAGLGLDQDLRDTELQDMLDNARRASRTDFSWRPGDVWEVEEQEWILEGLIEKGSFHAFYAPAKLGKTTVMLDFFHSLLVKQAQSFLDLKLNSSKNYTLYLIGPDMHMPQWRKVLNQVGLAQGASLHPKVQEVSPSRNEDGLTRSDLMHYEELAIQAQSRGEEPIFFFDCYSALMQHTEGQNASEISDLYYKPLRKLKLTMGKTKATTILLHHTSKSSRDKGAVDAAAGNSTFSRIPDVLVKLDWLNPNQNLTKSRDKRIVVNATGRIDPLSILIERGDDGHFINCGDVDTVLRNAYLEEEQVRLGGDYIKCLDFIDTCSESANGASIATVAAQYDWNMSKARRVVYHLKRKGLVWTTEKLQEHGPLGGRPAAMFKSWQHMPIERALGMGAYQDDGYTPNDLGFSRVPNPTKPVSSGGYFRPEASAGDIVADKTGSHTHKGLPPGSRVDLKLPTGHWQEGWIVKDSSGGEHTIWRYPDLTTFKSKQRIGIEIRVSNGTDDDEEL